MGQRPAECEQPGGPLTSEMTAYCSLLAAEPLPVQVACSSPNIALPSSCTLTPEQQGRKCSCRHTWNPGCDTPSSVETVCV
eukprot:4128465-Prymnesium_polylepis.1